jgi:hypothetical protein
VAGLAVVLVGGSLALSACSPGVPIALHVEGDIIDIAFCETFDAANVEIDFSKYPPPFMGPKYSIGMWRASGPTTTFGNGVPVSLSLAGWTFDDAGPIPDEWERIDWTFSDEHGTWVASEFIFDDDVTSDDWTWQQGFNTLEPQCELDLD